MSFVKTKLLSYIFAYADGTLSKQTGVFDVTQVQNPINYSKKNSLLSQFILENLKISLYVRLHKKTMPWKFRIINPKNAQVILPMFELFLKSKLLLRYKHFWDIGIFLKAGDTGSLWYSTHFV